jgi:hypothetical protein
MLIPGAQRGVEALHQLGDKLRQLAEAVVGNSNPQLALDGMAVGADALSAPLEARARKEQSSPKKDAGAAPPPVIKSGNHLIEISPSAWKKLTPALQERMRTPSTMKEYALVGIAAQTLKEVSRFKPEYAQEAVTRVLNYQGRPELLKGVFDRCQSYDPLALGNDFEVHVLPVGSLSSENLAQLHAYRGEEDGGSYTTERYTVRSDSGAVLIQSPHIMVRKSDPATIVSVGGRELMVSHGEVFFGITPELITERRARLEQRAHESVLEVLRGASLTDVLHSDELSKAAGRSPLLARNLEAYKELIPVLEEAHRIIQNATYGIGFGVGKAGCVHLKSDFGGQLLSWCEKNAASMPRALQTDLELLLYSPQELSLAKQQRIISVLAAYRISHSTINLQVALAPLQEDLAALDALPDSSPYKVPELYEAARLAIANVTQSVSADSQNEIRLDRLPDLLHTPLQEFRIAVNSELLSHYREEFFEAVESFKPLFCDGNLLKPEFRGEGIALESLKQTVDGAEIGIRSFEKNIEPTERFAALSRDDFFNIREAIYYLSISSQNESSCDPFCSRLSIPNFRALVTGVITAHRKASSIDAQYKNWHFENAHTGLPEPVSPGNHLTTSIDGEALKTFTPIVAKGRKILPKEEFAETFGISLDHCLKVRDFLKFGDTQAASPKTIFDQWSFLAEAGLYNAGIKDSEQEYLAANGAKYLPRSAYQGVADLLNPLYGNPFIKIKEERFSTYPFDNRTKLEAPFLEKWLANKAKMLEAVMKEKDIFEAITTPLSEEDRENYRIASSTRFLLRGGSSAEGASDSFTLEFGQGSTFIGEWSEREIPYTTIDGTSSLFTVQWLDAQTAVSRSRELLASTVPHDQLSTVGSLVSVQSAPSLGRPTSILGPRISSSSEGERIYQSFTKRLSSVTSYRSSVGSPLSGSAKSKRIAEDLPHWIVARHQDYRIERALVEAVFQATQIDPDRVAAHSDGWFKLHDTSIEVTKGKKHRGVDLYDVLLKDPTYITKYLVEILQHQESRRLIDAVVEGFQRSKMERGGESERRRVFIEEFTRNYFSV